MNLLPKAGLPVLILAGAAAAGGTHQLPLDRPYTSRNGTPSLTEREIARQIASGGPLSFIFPRPCVSRLDSSSVCEEPGGYAYRDTAQRRRLALSPLAAYEARTGDELAHAAEIGLVIEGASGPLSFFLDSRMFTEMHEDRKHASFDGEFVERQDEEASGGVAYSSYSRYRSNLSSDFAWGRFTVARDAAHWGPGLITNLSFNQAALPFNQVAWTSHLGPLSVISLYGRLAIHGDSLGTFNLSRDTRSIYAHRYEWRLSPDLVLGASEQLVLYEWEEPFAFIPIVPLFILKGTGLEKDNNGNISVDFAWRTMDRLLVYTEFLVDDIQSPATLFDDNWGNKWAWMAGLHGAWETAWGRFGAVAEYSRVEPWVYTHYFPATAQIANGGRPLGNPLGPNSQWMALRPYVRGKGGWYAAVQADLTWKGVDPGSSLVDSAPSGRKTKSFLEGIGSPAFRLEPVLAYAWKSLRLEGAAAMGDDPRWRARIHWQP